MTGGELDVVFRLTYSISLALAVAVLWPLTSKQGMTISESGIVVRRGIRTTRALSSDVGSIDAKRGRPGLESIIVTTRTRVLGPPYPSSWALGKDPQFAVKLAGIQDWWVAHRPSS